MIIIIIIQKWIIHLMVFYFHHQNRVKVHLVGLLDLVSGIHLRLMLIVLCPMELLGGKEVAMILDHSRCRLIRTILMRQLYASLASEDF